MIPEPSKVTVVIPTYRHEHFIGQCLDSLLQQTRLPADIIVINDGSPDNTDGAVAPYLPYIRYFKQDNRGIAYTMNRGISLVKTSYFCILNSDDWLAPMALETLEQALDTHPEAGIAHASRWKVGHDGALLPQQDRETEGVGHVGVYEPLPSLLQTYYVMMPAIMFRTAAITEENPVPDFRYCPDWALFIKVALNGWQFFGIQQPLGYYRRHADNTTHIRYAAAILKDEIAMLHWVLETLGDTRTNLREPIKQSVDSRLRSLGWVYLDTSQWDLAQKTFAAVWQRGNRERNTLLGLTAAHSPRLLYQSLRYVRRRLVDHAYS